MQEEKKEKDLRKEEIGEAVMKIKQKEAGGIDEILAETWKFGGETLKKKKRLMEILRTVWKEKYFTVVLSI